MKDRIDYLKHSKLVKDAFFRWKKDTPGNNHTVVDFVSGYNAAIADLADLIKTSNDDSDTVQS